MNYEKNERTRHMFEEIDFSETDVNLLILNFATRLLTLVTDKDALICAALETIADFSQSGRVAILTSRKAGETLKVEGVFSDRRAKIRTESLPTETTPFSGLIAGAMEKPYMICKSSEIPVSEFAGTDRRKDCLCMPIVATDRRILGVAVIELDKKINVQIADMQYMYILITYLAIALENIRLFGLVLIDGLTGIYVRRYYDIRINEELARLKRASGSVAVVLFDLDNFKDVNDRFGHAAGDVVLREFAGLLENNLRKGVDVVCRFGGEEFIAILPGAGLEQAVIMSERIREKCQNHVVRCGDDKIRFTVSGGVAATDSGRLISGEQLFERIDAMLYRAKRGGRNRIDAWKET